MPEVGQTLTVSNGSWSAAPDSFARQWRRAGTAISGATGQTYVCVSADVGNTLTCTVTASKSGYTSATATSAATTAVTAAAATMVRLTKTSAGMLQKSGVNFRTGGINAFQLITNDYPNQRLMTNAQIDSLFAKAAALKVGIIRAHTLAASVGKPLTLVTGVSGTGSNPTIAYNQDVWDRIDYAVWKARQVGIYLIAPLVDELAYFHGGKRQWVNFRRPGTVDLNGDVKAANSSTQRTAENFFYTDTQIQADFRKFVSDWLNHVNPLTQTAFKDEPVLSIVETGNELWTAAQDAPTWTPGIAAYIKSIAPTTLVMEGGSDGLRVEDMSWSSANVDIIGTHPYSIFTAADVRQQAIFAASKGKAYMVGEYGWSKTAAPDVELAVRESGSIFTSALWSLQNDEDLHNNGVAYGGDDSSFYVPGKNGTETAAVARVTAHHQALIDSAPTAVPPTTPTQGSDAFTGTDGSAWSTDRWISLVPSGFGNTLTIVGNKGRMHLQPTGGYDGNTYAIAVSRAPASVNQTVTFPIAPAQANREAYFRVAVRSSSINTNLARETCYFAQIGAEISGVAYADIGKRVNGVETFFPGGGVAINGWASGAELLYQFSAVGSTITLKIGGATIKTATDTAITAAGSTGLELRGGNAAVTVDWDINQWALT